ncbi:MAG: alpha/beta fold hydrolase [Nevskiales bacterium]
MATANTPRRNPPKLQRRTLASVGNMRDRFFRTEHLVKAEQTPFEVIHRNDIAQLRYYPPLDSETIDVAGETIAVSKTTAKTPLVLVSPLAVNMYLYDLFPERSLVKYLRARGFELYLVDWGRPGWRHNHFHLYDYICRLLPEMLGKVREHSGQQKLSLHGWSFGGLFSLCAAADDPDIANLALIGAPCDYHANGELGKNYQRIARQLRWVEKRTGWRIHNSRRRWWRSPGWANSLMFKLTNPVGTMQGYVELATKLHDRDFVISHATNSAFLEDMVAYPGGVIQDVIQYLWADNRLADGHLPLNNHEVHLSQVTAPIMLVSGHKDVIVTHECSQAMLQHVSSKDTTTLEVPGGHMGILGGSVGPKHIWAPVADWLLERS